MRILTTDVVYDMKTKKYYNSHKLPMRKDELFLCELYVNDEKGDALLIITPEKYKEKKDGK